VSRPGNNAQLGTGGRQARRELGSSAGSLRLWAAGHVNGFADLLDAAALAGIDPLDRHRQFTRGTGR
jgi:hypothetical protein